MKKLIVRDAWTLRLATLCAALGFLLLINSVWRPEARLPEIADPDTPAETGAAPASVQEAGTAAPDGKSADVATAASPKRPVKPLPAYGVTLKRPLFHAARRPPPPQQMAQAKRPPKPVAPPRSNLNGIKLMGVIMTAEKAFGLLSIPGQSELLRAREGQVVKGWKVISVEEDALVLNNGEEDYRMALWEERQEQNPATRPPQHGSQARGQAQSAPGSPH